MSRRPHIPSRRRTRRAFTLIELLIVIVIIGILSTLLLVGIKYIQNNAKRQQTRATLAQCQAMYDAWQAVAHQPFPASVMPAPGAVGSYESGQPQADRDGSAVWFTRDIMFQIRSVPANATILGKLPSSQLMTFPSAPQPNSPPDNPPPSAWNNTNSYTPFESSDYGRVYVIDAQNNTTFYDCIQYVPVPPSGGYNTPPSQDPTHWLLAYATVPQNGTPDNSVPVVLDAWGNPIIFVAGGTLGAAPGYTITNGVPAAGSGGMVSGTGSATLASQAKSPDGRPFFASAGPDGDFSKGDDNLYSYER